MTKITCGDYDRNHCSALPPIHTPIPSFCEYGFGFFLKQKVDYTGQNFSNRGFLFAGSLFFLLPLLTCYQRYSRENVRQFSIISVRNISSLRCQHNSFKLSTGKKIQVSLKEKSILVLIIRHTHMCGHTHKQFFFQICHCFHHLHSYLSLD